MAIRIQLNHHTHYQYDRMVFTAPQLIRLKPAAQTQASITSYSLTVEPKNHVLHWQQDPFGNSIARVDFSGPVPMITIQVQLVADLEPINPFDFFVDTYAESFPFEYKTLLGKELALYRETTESGPLLTQWLGQIGQPEMDTVSLLTDLNQQVYRKITYSERLQPGVQTAEETLRQAVGSCRDVTWLLIQLLRHLGLAARFVSGYLIQLKSEESTPDSSLAIKTDSVALHAWAEVYIPGAGWIGLDPTSGMLTTEGHIPLTCAPDPIGAAPVTGTTDPAEVELTYTSTLIRLP